MELVEHIWPGKVVKSGIQDPFVLPVGKRFRIETTPDGEEILDAVAPAGKVWSIRIIVEIEETDAV